jgi:hypothetical protein
MSDAGDRPLVPDLVRQGAAQAGQQCDANRARRAGDGDRDLVRDRLAQGRESERPAPPIGAGQQFRRGEAVAHRAEAFEPGLARVVETARLDWRRRRHQERAQPDAIAGLEGRLRAAGADPDPGRGRVRLEPLDGQLAKQKALTADLVFHEQDRAFEFVRGPPIEHRRLDQVRAPSRHRKTEHKDESAEQAWRPDLEGVRGQAPPHPAHQK